MAVVNFRLKRGMILHDALNGFRVGEGMGTATLEAKLVQYLIGLAQKPLFQAFLDVRKVYSSLDRGQCMDIMWGCGMGQRMDFLIARHWDNHQFVPKTRRFIGKAFCTWIGVTQGETAPPMIFNIVVDAVVRAVLVVVCGPQEAQHGMGWATGK